MALDLNQKNKYNPKIIIWLVILFLVLPFLINTVLGKDNEFGTLITVAIIFIVFKSKNFKKIFKSETGSLFSATKSKSATSTPALAVETADENSTDSSAGKLVDLLINNSKTFQLTTNNIPVTYEPVQSLQKNGKYLQIALNGTRSEALAIAGELPVSNRIILEAGTPLIKNAGLGVIRDLSRARPGSYIVADLKTVDLADREVSDAVKAGANAVVVLGVAPIVTLNKFIAQCQAQGVDSMIDMMNVPDPLSILKQLKTNPTVVIVHRGVDETESSQGKMIPYYQINKIKGMSNVKVSIAGGDTLREIESAFFNGADLVVVWKDFMNSEGGFIKTVN